MAKAIIIVKTSSEHRTKDLNVTDLTQKYHVCGNTYPKRNCAYVESRARIIFTYGVLCVSHSSSLPRETTSH